MKSYCIKVKKQDTQKTLKKFSSLLNKNLKFKKESEYILIPIVKKMKDCLEDDFEELKPKIKDYKQLLPKLKKLPTSYDIIGDIIVIKLQDELNEFKKEIANALLQTHKNVRIVAMDKGVKGDFRVRDLEIIGERDFTEKDLEIIGKPRDKTKFDKGINEKFRKKDLKIANEPKEIYKENIIKSELKKISKKSKNKKLQKINKENLIKINQKTSESKSKKLQTTHKEFGINLKINLNEVYFSPRLATEHYRVCSLVKDGEIVVDMFSGIGSFAIMIAKYKNAKIYAIDLNKNAIKCLKENIKINKVKNVLPICGDAREVMKNLEKSDRIIMNLPFSAKEFFGTAINSLKERGVIHYYDIIDKEKLEERIKELKEIAKKNKRKLKLLSVRKVRGYSTKEDNFVMDLEG